MKKVVKSWNDLAKNVLASITAKRSVIKHFIVHKLKKRLSEFAHDSSTLNQF